MTSWMKRLLAIALVVFVMMGMGFVNQSGRRGSHVGKRH